MSRTVTPVQHPSQTTAAIPPLRNGDHLDRQEFHRRYLTMPEVKKAELIEGIVYMPERVRFDHGRSNASLTGWLGQYVSRTLGLSYGIHGTVRLDDHNEVQPDVMCMLPPHLGGRAFVDDDDYITGPPDLVIEVCESAVSIDLHAKMEAYRRNGVQEYWVHRLQDEAIDLFVLNEGRYTPLDPEEGFLKSCVLPGLWLDVEAVLAGDFAKAFAAVDAGCATDEHAAFVKRLSM